MKLEHLRTFIRIVEDGSFTKASRLLKQPVSRVSRNIQVLEEEIGTPLLYRTTRLVNLTQAGKTLYERIRAPLGDLDYAIDSIRSDSADVAGLLRVTAIGDMAPVVAALVAKFRARYQRVEIEMIIDDRVRDLVKESIDVALRVGTLSDSSFRSSRLGEIESIFVASRAYVERSAAVENEDDLAKHSLLYFEGIEGHGRPEWKVRSKNGKTRTLRVAPSYSSNQTGPILNLALNGHGIALLPKFLCSDALRTGQLVRLLRSKATTTLPVHLVWNQNAKAQHRVSAFIDLAKQELRSVFQGESSDPSR